MKELKNALFISLSFSALLWTIKAAETVSGISLSEFGIFPGKPEGLAGILAAPFIHGDFIHLFSNTMPILVLGTGILYLYPESSRTVIPAVYLIGGLGVWIFARPASHIGASGLIYGAAAFIFASGILRRDKRSIALFLIAVFLYGGMVWRVLPFDENVSFESHLSSFLTGIICAVFLRKKDLPEPAPAEEFDEDEDFFEDEYWKE